MAIRPITVVELSTFISTASSAGMSDEERSALVDYLAWNPTAGDVVPETNGLRKLRWARPGGGRRGGYRVISYYFDTGAPIYAIYVYGKNRRADLSSEQRRTAAKFAVEIKTAIKAKRAKAGLK